MNDSNSANYPTDTNKPFDLGGVGKRYSFTLIFPTERVFEFEEYAINEDSLRRYISFAYPNSRIINISES